MQNFSGKVKASSAEGIGWHLNAIEDIKPGEEILQEAPFFLTPHWENDQMKCSKCFRQSFVMCRKCNFFPLCMNCSDHDQFDCNFLKSCDGKICKNLLVKNYSIFAVLKILLLLENPNTHDECQKIFATNINLNDYRDSDIWKEQDSNIVKPLINANIADVFSRVKVDSDRLHEICFQIDASSFEVNSKDGDSIRGVYVYGAKLPHNCVPNTVISLDNNSILRIYAASHIKQGELIFNSYANPLMGTSQRQLYLRLTKFIDCACQRCLDATELGTHMSSFKCKNCSNGFVICKIDTKTIWQCTSCEAILDTKQAHTIIAEVGEKIASADGSLCSYEDLLLKYSALFHPNHFLLIDIKQNILTLLSEIDEDPVCADNRNLFARKIQLCQEMLPVVRAVSPGLSKLYAILQVEYVLPLVALAQFEWKSEEISREQYQIKLIHGNEIIMEALEMLSFEPPESPEARLVQTIAVKQKNIQQEIVNSNCNS